MKPAILDEDLGGSVSCHDDAGKIYAWDVALHRLEIQFRTALGWLADLYTNLAKEVEVGMIASQCENKIIF